MAFNACMGVAIHGAQKDKSSVWLTLQLVKSSYILGLLLCITYVCDLLVIHKILPIFAHQVVVIVQERRDRLDQTLKPPVGQEPFVVLSLDEESKISGIFVVGDGTNVCQSDNVKSSILHLLSLYFLININYPPMYSQMLGFLQLRCLGIDFPPDQRSDAFVRLHASV
jgi:hypothetical protein